MTCRLNKGIKVDPISNMSRRVDEGLHEIFKLELLRIATWSAFNLSSLASLQWTQTSERVTSAPHHAADLFHACTM